MRTFDIGIVLPLMQFGPDRTTARWPEIREMAQRVEAIGFDTIWTPDELLWRASGGPPQGVFMFSPGTMAALEALATVVEQLRAD